jgi:UDP-N-acetylglucosamine 2-epimerase (non-hydrolysing)
MAPGQTLPELTARLMVAVDRFLADHGADLLLVQGDTTSAMVAGLAAFYRNIPVGHVEAGLRTHNLRNPFPEELNRSMLSRLAAWHFCPTAGNRDNLAAEGIKERVVVTGNTVIDALMMVAAKDHPMTVRLDPSKRLILATVHRRESFGEPMRRIAAALRSIARRFPDTQIVLPVHPNPSVKETIERELAAVPNISLCEPLAYGALVTLLKRCHFVITDSGGLQEEAPALGKPVLVVREETERPEAVEAGVARLVGTRTERIVDAAAELLEDEARYRAMAQGRSPYGDGKAAERIAGALGM